VPQAAIAHEAMMGVADDRIDRLEIPSSQSLAGRRHAATGQR
jgi:hypothetical protein